MREIDIPVYHIDRDGRIGTDFINCSPCIRVAVTDPSSKVSQVVYGLIDTGADNVWLDNELIVSLGATATGEEISYGASSQHMSSAYEGMIQLEGLPPLTCRYLSMALRENRRRYDVVIGRAVLSLLRLTIDGPTGAVRLSYPNP
jgi:predicted aspartyl protease